MSFDIVPTNLAVKAMRDNGYKNAAYAIAELMDNSIEAGATYVELLCAEEEIMRTHRKSSLIREIAVLDNGSGMDAETLRIALQFGNGTHLETRTGIGRFGMGLPSSSISQACRVDVWTWQNGIESAIHSYLDIDEITLHGLREVPEPEQRSIPDTYQQVTNGFGETGTLVIWSKLDRIMWKKALAIIKNSEFVIGRMYRNFLANDSVQIRLVSFNLQQPDIVEQESYAKPNDPIYLMENTSCPSPWDAKPMFAQWGEELVYHIQFNGEIYPVSVRYSYAREEARSGYQAGRLPHGKHASRNVGVSIVRADRELDLDPSWSNPSEPRDRWWGVEVDFPPALDELFGVTNNKQSARNFSDLAKTNIEDIAEEEGLKLGAAKETLDADQDPRLPLLEIAQDIKNNINAIRRLVFAQKASSTSRDRHDRSEPTEHVATLITTKRKDEGYFGESDEQESSPAEQRQLEIEETLIEEGVPSQDATEIAANTVARGFKYTFVTSNVSSPAFFDVKSRGGSIIVSLNANHPAYPQLLEVLEDEISGNDVEQLQQRLARARDGIELLLMAWARYEDEQPDGRRRTQVQDVRWEWGKMARQFLEDESDY